jgi:hypothetical protein
MALIAAFCAPVVAQKTVIFRPKEIDDVLTNPGIGFMTFQRFNGDTLNQAKGWTEGKPIVYQDFDGDLTNEGYPDTTIAYFRIYWKFIEPEQRAGAAQISLGPDRQEPRDRAPARSDPDAAHSTLWDGKSE